MIYEKIILGNKVFLKTLLPSGVTPEYYKWLKSPLINKYLEVRHDLPKNIEDLCCYVDSISKSKSDYLFGIYTRTENKYIGNIKIGNINKRYGRAEVGIVIGDSNSWGKGYAADAINVVKLFSFSELGLRKLVAGCYESNVGSLKAFIKAGFTQEGFITNYWSETNNISIGEIILGINKSEWETEKQREN